MAGVLRPSRSTSRPRSGSSTSARPTPGSAFLSLALIFSASAFYGFYEEAPRLWGLSAEKDQNLGGILMNGEQMAVFFAALSYFLLRLLSEEEESQRALERP